MGPVWIVVADSHHARIYAQPHRGGHLSFVEEDGWADAKLQARDIVSDRPGVRRGEGMALRANTTSDRMSREEIEDRRFVHRLAARLEKARAANQFEELVLVMNPRALGMLRGELDARTRDRIAHEVPKDLMHLDDVELPRRLEREWFAPGIPLP